MTHRIFRLLLAGFLLALYAPLEAHAQGASAMASEPRVALVIGNSAYKAAPLKNPGNDADDVAQALRSLNFRVTLLKDASNQAMIKAINAFGQELRKGGVGLFFFAGHGVQSRGRNYLIPVGSEIASEDQLEFDSVDAYRVLSAMDNAGNRVNIVILDACRDNPYARTFRSSSRGLAQMDAARGSFIAFATAPGQMAADGTGRNGLYTQHLLQSLKQPDTDIDKVFRRVTGDVSRASAGKQVPWISHSLTGDFYFRLEVKVPASASGLAAAVGDRNVELAFWDTIRSSTNRADFEEYLRQYPDGRFAGLARNRVGSLAAPPAQVATLAPPTPPVVPKPTSAFADRLQGLAPGTIFRDCDVCPEMVVISAGSFTMGSPEHELGRDSNEGPQHQVIISQKFAAGRFEVTFDEWDACVRDSACGHEPPDQGWGRSAHPVINVSWYDAKQYVNWLTRKTGRSYRLLSEAEWEYVARAGTTTPFHTGSNINPTQANLTTAFHLPAV